MAKNFVLLILDGLGLNQKPEGNAVHHATTPNLDKLSKSWPSSTLITHGEKVGLPEGQMGNSEVGHLNIGAGRVVKQDLLKINQTIKDNLLKDKENFQKLVQKAKQSALHLVGLTSEGGVHSDIKHLAHIVEEAAKLGAPKIYIHGITDGRDQSTKLGLKQFTELEKTLKNISSTYQVDARIVSLIGRYYAMDRDKREERTEKAWKLFIKGEGKLFNSIEYAFQAQYDSGLTDEFLEAAIFENHKTINKDDAVLFYNFRADRMRQIVSSLLFTEGFEKYNPKFFEFQNSNQKILTRSSNIFTLTEYDADFELPLIFDVEKIEKHLGDILANSNLTQLRIAETEKYPHVTYFFSGGAETVLKDESRSMLPSPKDVPTYDLKPEMSVYQITDNLINHLESGKLDVAIVNFANCDMVGHTGSFDAAVKAVEAVDDCLGKILACLDKISGSALITADHGNAEEMIQYESGQPHTFHTTNPVPIFLYGDKLKELKIQSGALCDISPTILEILNIKQPKEMTGESLIIKN